MQDKWTDDQVKKMKLGGNKKAKNFFTASPDYNKSMTISEIYNAHFAAQYRDKVRANCV